MVTATFNSKKLNIKYLISFVLSIAVFSFCVNAIVIRHDVSDKKYITLGEQYLASTAYIQGCTSTLIDEHWLLTAAHCVTGREESLFTATHMNKEYRINTIVVHPNYDINNSSYYDIALIQLKEPIKDGKPATLYSLNNENGKEVIFVGRGVFGNGRDGLLQDDYQQRGASNTIIEVQDKIIGFQFDSPRNATELEGISGPGDSGGPAFVHIASQLYVLGVSSYQDANSFKEAHYGVKEYYTRVSTFYEWLNSIMLNTDPAVAPPKHPLINAIVADDGEALDKLVNKQILNNDLVLNEAFYQSVLLDRIELAKQLISKGVSIKNVRIFNMSLFEFTLLNGRNDYFNMLLNEAITDESLHDKNSVVLPFLISSFSDDAELVNKVKTAVKQGANINARDSSGNTALIVAGWSTDNLKLIRYLVESGANIDEPNSNGDTALIDAAYLDKTEILRYLLMSGANPLLKNNSGKSAIDFASNTNKELILAEIRKREP